MSETIEISRYEQDFKKRVISITDTTEPSTPNLTIVNKQQADINIDIRVGFDLSFIESGKLKFLTRGSQFLLNDDELSGLQDVSSGTITLKKDDKIDLSMWNTDGGTFTNVVLIFVNSKSDGTFVDPLALLEATSKSQTLINSGQAISNSPLTNDFSMAGYKNLVLGLGAGLGLPNNSVILSNPNSWLTPINVLRRDTSVTTRTIIDTTDQVFIIDCLTEVTGIIAITASQDNITPDSVSHIEIEYSTDNISYFNALTTSTLIEGVPTLYKAGASHTFRYLKIKGVWSSGGFTRYRIANVGFLNFFGCTVTLKFQTSDDSGITWSDFIIDSEFDTSLTVSDYLDEVFNIGRFNASNTGVFYLLPQGSNKIRVHTSLSLYSSYSDPNDIAGYGGLLTLEKLS